jgi:hypothetical protein
MTGAPAYKIPSVSVDLHPPKPRITRNLGASRRPKPDEARVPKSSLLRVLDEMLAREGERETSISEARATCEHCGHRALNRQGHPIGKTGKPKCLEPPEEW